MEFVEWYEESEVIIERNLCSRMPGLWADVEDIRQEVGLLAYQQWDQLRNHPNLIGWTVCAARYRMLHRLQERARECSESERREIMPGAEEAYWRNRELLECLQGDEDGKILYLHAIAGYSYREMEEQSGIAASTLRKRGQRARARLAKSMALRGHSEGSVV